MTSTIIRTVSCTDLVREAIGKLPKKAKGKFARADFIGLVEDAGHIVASLDASLQRLMRTGEIERLDKGQYRVTNRPATVPTQLKRNEGTMNDDRRLVTHVAQWQDPQPEPKAPPAHSLEDDIGHAIAQIVAYPEKWMLISELAVPVGVKLVLQMQPDGAYGLYGIYKDE